MSSTEEQEKWLADAMALVQHHAFFMHRALARPFSSFAHALVLRSSRSLALLFNPRREGSVGSRRDLVCVEAIMNAVITLC